MTEEEYDQLESDTDSNEDPTIFCVRSIFPEPESKTITMGELHTRIHHGTIDLNPSWQREVVWADIKQSNLIESIYRNISIPPIVFTVEQDDDGEEIWICVDGKQRLTSIQKFIDGQIPYRDSKTNTRWWYTASSSKRGVQMEIPSEWKKKFQDKVLTYVRYQDLDEFRKRELFQRVQLGVSLTKAEKLRAIASPCADWIHFLVQKYVTVDGGLDEILDWGVSRGKAFQEFAQMVYCCDHVDLAVVPVSTKIEEWIVRREEPDNAFKADIENALRRLDVISRDPQLNEGFKRVKKRVSPLEFVFIVTLIFVMKNKSDKYCATAIHHLRTGIRRTYSDLLIKPSQCAEMWRLIHELEDNPTYGNNAKKRKLKTEDDDYGQPSKRGAKR